VTPAAPRLLAALALSPLLVVAACSNSTDTTPGAGDHQSATSSAERPAQATTRATSAGGPDDPGSGDLAVIRIGEETFEVDLKAGSNGCARPEPDVVAGGGFTQDADPSAAPGTTRTTGAYLTFAFSPPESPFGESHVVVDNYANGVQWWADAENRPSGLQPDQGLVIDWSDDGRSITGTASFIDPLATRSAQLNGLPVESVDGTFEIACGRRP
jgi:hypothetical protein